MAASSISGIFRPRSRFISTPQRSSNMRAVCSSATERYR